MRWTWLFVAGVSCGACMPQSEHGGASSDSGVAAQTLPERAPDAGAHRPPTGHLPEGPGCGAAGNDASGDSGIVLHSTMDAAIDTLFDAEAKPKIDAGSFMAGPSRAGDVVISEIMADPSALADSTGEWFELYNASGQVLSLRGCTLGDGGKEEHAIGQDLVLTPGGYASVARSAAPGFTPTAIETFSLTNTADAIVLTCDGVEIDRVAFDVARGFPVKAGVSMQLDAERLDAHDNDQAGAWCLARDAYAVDLGTPGLPNRSCTSGGADAG